MSLVRGAARRGLAALHRGLARPMPSDVLDRSALVVSPHFDDETLGCGGLIALKRRRGTAVTVVFMTDGTASHRTGDADALGRVRADEGRAACRELGVRDEDVVLLGLPETRLRELHHDAESQLATLLEARRPRELYAPMALEPAVGSDDHRATNAIVHAAVHTADPRPTVWEYAVWSWACWPWVHDAPGMPRGRLRSITGTLDRNAHLARTLRHRLDVTSVLDVKRRALCAHRSQMERPPDRPDWTTLGDVSDGELLSLFFRSWEAFKLAG
jgi:LmbE family N-acetylglucosaminyl deacetylase